MKKVFTVLLCLLLIAGFAVSVSAAGSSVSISPSAKTLHRGDTFTIVANLSNTSAINLGTVVLDYDTSVFEMTGGTCHVSGANPAQVIPASKAGTFFLGTASAVSGKIFTFNFKVKTDAAFGSYNFTTKASIGTSTGNYIDATGTTVTVACKHSYSAWTKASDTQHSRTCSICQNVEKVNHTWNSGVENPKATCKNPGTKTYTCTGCNATKTETVAQLTTHSYGSWTKVSDTQHKHTCSVCEKSETVNHTWDNGKVTKKATCKEEGVTTFTCSGCKTTKTEKIAILTTHTYDNACDTNCNICNATRNITHNYKTSWSQDKTNHWHECSVCKDKKDVTAHTPGAEATETTAQKCTVCGYVIKAALGHTHDYASDWTTDENGHWHTCSGCEEKGDYADHAWNDGEVTKEATETETGLKKYTCTVCGATKEETLDKLTPGASEPAPTQPTESQPTPSTPSNGDAGNEQPAEPFSWVIVIVAVVVIAGAVAAVLIIKKKKNA